DKIPRIIPKGKAVEIDKYSWRVPGIFSLIQKKGNIEDRMMYRALNMGIGMALVISKGDVDKSRSLLAANGFKSHIIGRVVKGNREVAIL
ncbi:MAG: phosphoribosylformylglycinamidine cyclo-ligase, partial [Candidatus Omnitrophica bacterium]|nr:phosphoribosylformylglycinamidine cyclo-ligase [Candidatus Omnitrophota bacterium]